MVNLITTVDVTLAGQTWAAGRSHAPSPIRQLAGFV